MVVKMEVNLKVLLVSLISHTTYTCTIHHLHIILYSDVYYTWLLCIKKHTGSWQHAHNIYTMTPLYQCIATYRSHMYMVIAACNWQPEF